MKIFLINPRSNYIVKSPPLGLISLAAFARSKIPNVEIRILDAHLEEMSEEELLKEVSVYSPDIVGIYTISSNVSSVFTLVEKLRPHVRYIVGGGPFATVFGSYMIKNIKLDYVVMGEGEWPFVRLVQYLIDGRGDQIDGHPRILSRNDSDKHYQPGGDQIGDLDTLPLPAWDLLDTERYFKASRNSMSPVVGTRRVLPIFTSRGCPFGCAYCHNMFGKIFRPRPVDSIIDEIELLIRTYGVEAIEIWDDVFNLDINRVKAFCASMRRRGVDVKLSFSNGIRADLLTSEIVDDLVSIGTRRMNFGIESGSSRIQSVLCKNQDLKKVDAIVRYAATKRELITGGFFIIGNPTETRDEMMATIDYAVNLPIDMASFFACTPNPGTRLFEMLKKDQRDMIMNLSPDKFNYHEAQFDISTIPSDEVKKLLRRAYFRFYFNIRRLMALLRKVKCSDIIRNGLLVAGFVLMPRRKLFFREKDEG